MAAINLAPLFLYVFFGGGSGRIPRSLMPATQIAEAFSERLGNGRSADALPEPRNTDPLHAPERDRNEAVITDCGNGSLYRSAVRNAASTVIENLLVSRSFIPVYGGICGRAC